MVHSQELQLLSVREGLEKELCCVRGELTGCKDQLEVRGVELSKTRVHNQTLEKRIKVCVCQVFQTWVFPPISSVINSITLSYPSLLPLYLSFPPSLPS